MNAVRDVAVVQFKPHKGDVSANLATLREIFAQLHGDGQPDLMVLPEAALTGYFVEGGVYDLAVTADDFAARIASAYREATGGKTPLDFVCGFYEKDGGTFYNSAMYLKLGAAKPEIVHVHRKLFLPTYGVFDEQRFLTRGRKMSVFPTAFGETALMICEDAWHSLVPTVAALKGAKLMIVPSASPGRGLGGDGELESTTRWKTLLGAMAAEHGVYVLYAGLTGFEGGKGMSGSSCAYGPHGNLLNIAPALEACIFRVRIDPEEIEIARARFPLLGDLNAVLPDLLLDDELPVQRGVRSTNGTLKGEVPS